MHVEGGTAATPWSSVDTTIILLLLAVFAAMVFVVDPVGEFPLNDDWAYILPVEWLVKQGRLRFTDWQFMTLIGQVYLGAVTAMAFGFSITGLRLMVLSLAALTGILIYVIARTVRAPRLWALALAAVMLCNPIFWVTSASFMTDTPFLAASMGAILFFLLWQKNSSALYGVLAWLFVILACSIRQSAIALAIGFLAFSTIRHGFARQTILTSLLPTCVLAGLLAAYPLVMERTVGLPSMYNQPTLEAKAFIAGVLNLRLGYLWMATKTLMVAIVYLGLSVIPLLPLVFHTRSETSAPRRRGYTALTVAVSLIATLILTARGHAKPVDANTLFDFGLGIRTLESIETTAVAPTGMWWVITFLSILSVVSFKPVISQAVAHIRTKASAGRSHEFIKPYVVMILAVMTVYNLPFLTRGGIWFDRYSIPNLALFSLLVAPFAPARNLPLRRFLASALVMAGSLIFGVVATHDYLEWNRQRWAVAGELTQRYGIDFSQIDAGFEYNNYKPRQSGDFHRPPDHVLLSNPHAVYKVAFSSLPGYRVLKVLECRTWLYGSPAKIFLLRAETS